MKNWKHTTVLGGLLLPLALLLHPAPAQAEGQCIPISYIGNAGPQIATAFSHDGSMLLMSSSTFVMLYHIESGELIQSYTNPNLSTFISGVFYDEEKKHVLASHMDGIISAWDAESGALLNPDTRSNLNADSFATMESYPQSHNRWEIAGEETLVNSIRPFTVPLLPLGNGNVLGWFHVRTYDRDAPGPYLSSSIPSIIRGQPLDASGYDNRAVLIHEKRLKVFELPDTELVTLGFESEVDLVSVGGIAWSPDGNTIVYIGATDVYLLDPQTGAVIKKVPHDGGLPGIVDWTEGVLFAAYKDGRINLFNEETLTVESTINVDGGGIVNAHASPTGRRISVSTVLNPHSYHPQLSQYVYDLNSGASYTMQYREGDYGWPYEGGWSRSTGTGYIALAGAPMNEDQWAVVDIWRGNTLPTQIAIYDNHLAGTALSPNGEELFAATGSGLTRYDVDTGAIIAYLKTNYYMGGKVAKFEYSPDANYIYAYNYYTGSRFATYDSKTLEQVPAPAAPASLYYLSKIVDGNLQVIERATQSVIQTIPLELRRDERLSDTAISGDGSLVAIATSADFNTLSEIYHRLRLYDVATGVIIQEYPIVTGAFAFIDNDRFLHFGSWGFGYAKLAVRPSPCDGGEGESTLDAADILARFHSVDYDRNGLAGRGPVMVEFGISPDTFATLDTSGDLLLSIKELTAQIEGPLPIHSADADADGAIAIGELLRVIQLYNSGGYTCAPDPNDTEDGYQPAAKGALDPTCRPHASDYQDNNGTISLSELLRLIQLYTIGTLTPCPEAEDGFCAAA